MKYRKVSSQCNRLVKYFVFEVEDETFCFRVESIFQPMGPKAAKWDPENLNHHEIIVSRVLLETLEDITVKARFDFWQSLASTQNQTTEDILGAFNCFVSDSLMGLEVFDDFCSNLGYDNDSIKAKKAWKACKKSADKLAKILPDVVWWPLLSATDSKPKAMRHSKFSRVCIYRIQAED